MLINLAFLTVAAAVVAEEPSGGMSTAQWTFVFAVAVFVYKTLDFLAGWINQRVQSGIAQDKLAEGREYRSKHVDDGCNLDGQWQEHIRNLAASQERCSEMQERILEGQEKSTIIVQGIGEALRLDIALREQQRRYTAEAIAGMGEQVQELRDRNPSSRTRATDR